jgi:hypothetical protein
MIHHRLFEKLVVNGRKKKICVQKQKYFPKLNWLQQDRIIRMKDN